MTWHKEVWFSAGIPKHKFLTWLFVLDRCPTKDRMASWGLTVDPLCVLCNAECESRDHLFFNCPFTRDIWEALTRRSPFSAPSNWQDVMLALRSTTLTKPWRLLILLTWQATIYFSWSERNSRIHRSTFRQSPSIMKEVDKAIKLKIAALRATDSVLSSAMYQAWIS